MLLITGGAGYIGSYTALELLKYGYDIIIFDNLETGHIETVEILKKCNYKGKLKYFIKGDLRKKEDIEGVFKKEKISAVLHFASYAVVEESVREPEKYWENNVIGSLNLLNSMTENGVKNIVFSSTCATYGLAKYVPIDENHPQNPINPYGQTKLTVERIMDVYDKAYGLKSVRLRYFNAAGAGSGLLGEWRDKETHIIPNIIKSALNNEKFKIYGNDFDTKDGSAIRDYINVQDLAKAHINALKYLEKNQKTSFFNLGTGSGNSVFEILSATEKITGKRIEFEIKKRREGDPPVLIGDYSKAKNILGWEPEKTLFDSIKSAYHWQKIKDNI